MPDLAQQVPHPLPLEGVALFPEELLQFHFVLALRHPAEVGQQQVRQGEALVVHGSVGRHGAAANMRQAGGGERWSGCEDGEGGATERDGANGG